MTETGSVPNRTDKEYRNALLCVLGCQLLWGVLPVYWQALSPIPSWIIIFYRMFTMAVYSYIAARLMKYSREDIFSPLKERGVLPRYLLAGALLTANWSIYIWAMTTGHMVQSSIGYYIEPIVVCTFGIVFFKEKLTKYNVTAMVLAVVSLVIMLVHYRQLPGVALGLALTWASYSAIKKTTARPPVVELVYETGFYAIFALIGIIFIETRGIGALSYGVPGKYVLMFLSGFVTLVPILLFGTAAKKVSLFILGLAQYISPTITLLLGIFVYGEPVDKVQIISFVIIWIGLAFFSYGEFRHQKTAAPE